VVEELMVMIRFRLINFIVGYLRLVKIIYKVKL
jgi:hypothetical protein